MSAPLVSWFDNRITWDCQTCKQHNVSKWTNLPSVVVREYCQACNTGHQLTLKTNRQSYIHWYSYFLKALEETLFDPMGKYFYELASAFGYECNCDEYC
jgi:hypothetical protein